MTCRHRHLLVVTGRAMTGAVIPWTRYLQVGLAPVSPGAPPSACLEVRGWDIVGRENWHPHHRSASHAPGEGPARNGRRVRMRCSIRPSSTCPPSIGSTRCQVAGPVGADRYLLPLGAAPHRRELGDRFGAADLRVGVVCRASSLLCRRPTLNVLIRAPAPRARALLVPGAWPSSNEVRSRRPRRALGMTGLGGGERDRALGRWWLVAAGPAPHF